MNSSLGHYIYAFILGPALGGVLAGAFSLMHRKHFEPQALKYEAAGEIEATEKKAD